MSGLADRLRGVIGPGARDRRSSGANEPWEDSPQDSESENRGGRPQPAHCDPADLLGGEWRESRGHRFVTVDRRYSPGHRHGRVTVADGVPPSVGAWPQLALLAGASCGDRLLFLDLETTGLAGGAGTHAFLVGCAWFAGGTFRVRQFFLSNLAAERAMLEAVSELTAATDVVVTYNGKSFDLPLIETRFLFHRLTTPFGGMPHIDMLHPARRLWRPDEAPGAADSGGCRLSVLEQTQCGYVREGDVAGFEIPSRYFHFVRTGDARPLGRVFEHNRLDLLSLALITARAAQLLDEGSMGARTAREALGLGRLFERGGMTSEAKECYARAADLAIGGLKASCYQDGVGHPDGVDGNLQVSARAPARLQAAAAADSLTRAEALRAFAVLLRRERRHDEAAIAWRTLLDIHHCPRHFAREATLALAVYHEHRLRDPLSAKGFALRSLECDGSAARTRALRHRLTRLGRKLAEPASERPPLF